MGWAWECRGFYGEEFGSLYLERRFLEGRLIGRYSNCRTLFRFELVTPFFKMANVLLVDPDEVARRAMGGLLSRGGHRLISVDSVAEAWKLIRASVKVDLVFLELKLKGDAGISLVAQMKADSLLKAVPLVVYTTTADRESVKQTLELKAKNFLVKPYREELVYAEVSKAVSEPWWQGFFEMENTEWDPERVAALLEKLKNALMDGIATLQKASSNPTRHSKQLVDWLKRVSAVADKAGATGVACRLDELVVKASSGTWPTGAESIDDLGFAARLIDVYLDHDRVPEAFLTEEEANSEREAQQRRLWELAEEEERCPVISREILEREIDSLSGCPILDSSVAAFQMAANGHPTSLSPLLDLVVKDAGLTAQILIAANRLKKTDEEAGVAAIEEPRMAVGLLGELRLASLGGSLEPVAERLFDGQTGVNWPSIRLFQLATARMASFVCDYLELPGLSATAYTAGLMQDLGKQLLVHLHPFAFQEICRYAEEKGVSLAVAEYHFLGYTTREMAAYFAEKMGLPKRIQHVLHWVDKVEDAVDNADLVAVVSLARTLCSRNQVGFSGEVREEEAPPLFGSAGWAVLSKRVYLNFDINKFEKAANLECSALKRELVGKLEKKRVA